MLVWRKGNINRTVSVHIGTGVAPRRVHIDNQAVETVTRFTYLGSDIDSDGYSYPEIHSAWASLAPLWLNLTKSGVSKDSVSAPSLEYTPLLCSR